MTAPANLAALRETSPRLSLAAAPEPLRRWIRHELGSPVVEARTQAGGFSPGIAARLRCANGTRAFVKAVGPEPNPGTGALFRREVEILRVLPTLSMRPQLLAAYDAEGWVGLLLEDVAGRPPDLPWTPAHLDRVLESVAELQDGSPVGTLPESLRDQDQWRRFFDAWRLIAEEGAALDDWSTRHLEALVDLERTALAAVSIVEVVCHVDTRSDNILLTDERAVLVDWAMAATGPRWLDAAFVLLEVRTAGGEIDADELARSHPLLAEVDPEVLTAVWASLAGMFVRNSRRPAPPGLPTLRTFQRAYADALLEWTKERTRWR